MDKNSKKLDSIVKIDQSQLQDHLGEIVRGTVEETLNAMLDAEADALCQAQRYERTPERVDTRAGHYQRKFHTRAGEVTLNMPKLRRLTFETEIIQRYRRRECSVEEALMQMYLAGVSVRRVEDITEALWGTRVSSGTISNLNKQMYERIEKWRNQPIEGAYPYVYLDGLVLKRSWGGEVKNVSVLVAVGVEKNGHRRMLGVCEGHKEDKAGWGGFLSHLKQRGLHGVRLVISDACMGLTEAVAEHFPESRWQRCTVHFYRNVFGRVPKRRVREVSRMLKAIHAQESLDAALDKSKAVVKRLRHMKLNQAVQLVSDSIHETLTYYHFPETHWVRIRTNNPLERVMREVRRRTRVVGAFPDGQSALMLVAARLRHLMGTKWGKGAIYQCRHWKIRTWRPDWLHNRHLESAKDS